MTLDPAVYWKLAATMERINRNERDLIAQLNASREAALKEAGLEPGNYLMDDATYSVTLKEPPA